MNILIIPSWYPTPEKPVKGIFFKEQAESLARASVNVSVLHLNFVKRSILRRNPLRAIPRIVVRNLNGVLTVQLAWFYPGNSHYSRIAVEFIFALIGFLIVAVRGRPNIIHAQSVDRAGYVSLILSKLFSIPLVITEHSTKYERYEVPDAKLKRIRSTFVASNTNLVVSPSLANILGRKLGMDSLAFTYIPNFINTDFFRIEPRKSTSVVVSTICFLTAKKGVDVLLRSFTSILKAIPSAKLMIAGDGAIKSELESLAASLGIGRSVFFLGQLDRTGIRDLLNDTTVYVSSSYVETFGVTIIEALASGVPVVATRSGGPDTIVTDSVGLLVPTGNPGELSEAILKIIRNHDTYSPETIRRYCIENFGDVAVTKRLMKIYSALIAGTESA